MTGSPLEFFRNPFTPSTVSRWAVTIILGWMQRQPWLSLAPQQQVNTGDQVLELLIGGVPELLVREQLLVLG